MKKTHLLVSEKMPWMIMLFGYISIIPLIATGIFGWATVAAVQGIASGTLRIQTSCIPVNPPICTTFEAYPLLMPNLIGTIAALALAVACWALAFRFRAVWRDENGTIQITWGERILPITLHRFAPGDCTNVTVIKEKRLSVSPIVGTSVIRTSRAPDRWRIRGMVSGRRVNLGSYETESRANEVAWLFSPAANNGVDNDESGVWHYGKI